MPLSDFDIAVTVHWVLSNVMYLFNYACGHSYIGRTMQRLEERIKQHVPKSLFTSAECQEDEESSTLKNKKKKGKEKNSKKEGAATGANEKKEQAQDVDTGSGKGVKATTKRRKKTQEEGGDGCQHKCQRQGAPASEWAVEENDQDRWCARKDTATTMKFQCEENVRKKWGKSKEFSACVELM